MRTSITNPRSFAPSLKMSSSADSNTFICFLKDRKSTRLNSSHGYISYAVFCLKKKKSQDFSLRFNILFQIHYQRQRLQIIDSAWLDLNCTHADACISDHQSAYRASRRRAAPTH